MIAYFDCFSGISGDMTLGAFIDLGVPAEWLTENLAALPLDGFEIKTEAVMRRGIKAQNVTVDCTDNETSRDYAAIRNLIEESPLSGFVKELSLEMFKKIAAAEADIHGCSIDRVHFHELGGIDAIVDIVGTALCVTYFEIEKIVSSKIPLGTGFVKCRHGTMPVPAPASIAILKNTPVIGSGISQELVTPTGAAIITTLADAFEPIPEMKVREIGYGAGKRDRADVPNLLRVILGTAVPHPGDKRSGHEFDRISIVETCIDDMNPEIFGYTMERLFEDGAVDVYWTPVQMKKNRPGTMLTVLCRSHQKTAVIHRILNETSSIGVRYYQADREMLSREKMDVETEFGRVIVKKITGPDGKTRIVPEYEECKRIAHKAGIPIRDVYETIMKTR